MTVFTQLATLVRTTLLYLRSWLLYPFVRLSTRTAMPLSLGRASDDAEKQQSALAIGEDSERPGNGRGPEDLEKGVFCLDISPVLVAAQTSSNEIIAITRTTEPRPFKSHDHKVAPLFNVANSNATNVTPPRPPSSKNVHHKPESKSDSENASPARASCKPSPLRRMPRYLNLTGAAPASVKSGSSSVKESPAKSLHTPESSTHSHTQSHSDPPLAIAIIPLQSEAALALASASSTPPVAIDLAARIRSVFYGPRADTDESEPQVRDFFNRDSGGVPSGFGFALDASGSLGYIKDLDAPNLNKHKEDEEEDNYRKPLSVRSTSCSPSHKSTPSANVDPSNSTSELPYLRDTDSTSSLSASTTRSPSGTIAFNGLLSCIERRYPGHEWSGAVIQFSGSGSVQCVEQEGESEQWSDVLSLHDYSYAARALVRNLPRCSQAQAS